MFIKEFFRKRLVAIKRKPHMIPLVVMGIAYIYYSLNLSSIAKTTSLINGSGMGLSEFGSMLFGVLLLVCFMNAFPHRKRVNVPMLLMMIFFALVVSVCDIYYFARIVLAITRVTNRIEMTDYIISAYRTMIVHVIILQVGLLLTAFLPLYTKLLRKINTNIFIEDNGNMGKIDISGEDA